MKIYLTGIHGVFVLTKDDTNFVIGDTIVANHMIMRLHKTELERLIDILIKEICNETR